MASSKPAEYNPHAIALDKSCWIEDNLFKRECIRFVQDEKNSSKCVCGLLKSAHPKVVEGTVRTAYPLWGERWFFTTHTAAFTTDAFGTIEFQGGSHPTKARYVRLAFDTPPETVFQLLRNHWGLDIPKLLISVHGGIANFDLQPKLRRVCRHGLFNAAKTTGAWVTTGGTNSGVMRHVGDALGDTLVQSRHNIISIGIAPWGVVHKREDLVGRNRVVPYHAMSQPGSDNIVLNSSHSYFLLADDGSVGRFGCETYIRKSLEKYISQQRNIKGGCKEYDTPVVCLLMEGGINCIRTVLDSVTDHPPIPVVILDGSGRASDLLAFTHKYSQSDGTMPDILKDQLLLTISKTFKYSPAASERVYSELMLCTKKKNLITVFRVGEENQDIDQAILAALLKGHKGSSLHQLNLVMAWDRVDMARNQIFNTSGHIWPEGALDQAMMDALLNDRVDFVKLFIENGLNMTKWLTVKKLEDLYNQALNAPRPVLTKKVQFTTTRSKLDTTSTLRHLLTEHSRSYSQAGRITLYVIGQVLNKLMGGAYQSSYCRRKFRCLHLASKHKSSRNISEAEESSVMMSGFKYPYSELMVWAVLLRRQKMALCMWERGEEALAKCLVAAKLYKSMIREAEEDEYEIDVAKEISLYYQEFFDKALELLDHCYKTDDELTQLLLTYELNNWGNQTCLSLAVAGSNRNFIAHTCCQILLAQMWMGGLRTRKYPSLKILCGLVFFPLIIFLDYRTKEELEMMPQTQEEHTQQLSDVDWSDFSDSDTSDVENPLQANPSTAVTSVVIEMTPVTPDEGNAGTVHQSENNLLQKQNSLKQSSKTKGVPHASPLERSMSKRHKSRVSLVDISKDPANDSRVQRSQLHWGQKIIEFYTAPITKFWLHTISYCAFLLVFIYMMLGSTQPWPTPVEWFVTSYMLGLFFEKIREFITSEPTRVKRKVKVFFGDGWNLVDTSILLLYMIGFSLRFQPENIPYARDFYSLAVAMCMCRVVEHFVISPHLGPVVHILGKMIKEFLYLMVFLLVSMVAFGTFRLSVWFPDNEFNWGSVREIFLKPYFMLYGEVYHEIIWPQCETNITGVTSDESFKCVPGRWMVPVALSLYLSYGIIVLLSLVIAVFNNVFMNAYAHSNAVWKFQRYLLVIEYESRPILPSPFIIISHIILLVKFIIRKCSNKHKKFDQGLKVFLHDDDLEKLHDFEEECMEIFHREKQQKTQSTDEYSVKQTANRMEVVVNRLDDVQLRENSISQHLLMMQTYLNKVEESSVTTNKTLWLLCQQMKQLQSSMLHVDNDNNNTNHDRATADQLKSSAEFTSATEASGFASSLPEASDVVRQRKGSYIKSSQQGEFGRTRTSSTSGRFWPPEDRSLHPSGRLRSQSRSHQSGAKVDSKFHFKPISEFEMQSGDETSDGPPPPSYDLSSKSSFLAPSGRKLPFMPLTPIVTPMRVEYSSITDEIDASFLINNANPSPPDTPPYFQSSSIPILKQRRRKKKASKEAEERKTMERDRLQEAEENVNEQLKTVVSRRIRQLSLTEPAEFGSLAMDALEKMERREDEELSDYGKMLNVERNKPSSRSHEEIKDEEEAISSKLKFVRSEPAFEPPDAVSMEMSLLTLKEDEEEEGNEERDKRKIATEEEVISFSTPSAEAERSSTRAEQSSTHC